MSKPEGAEPLSALLSQFLVVYTIEVDNEFELRMSREGYAGTRLSLVVWTNVLKFIPIDGISPKDLASRSLSSTDRLKLILGCLERWGFVTLKSNEADIASVRVPMYSKVRREGWGSGRGIALDSTVRLTNKGKLAAKIWPNIWAEVEESWKQRLGLGDYRRLHDELRDVANLSEYELPEGLPGLGSVEEKISFPSKGREPEESDIPLSVLISRVLLMFAMEYNRRSRVSLALCANVIRVLGTEPVNVGDLAALTGCSSEASDIGWQLKPFVQLENNPDKKRGKVVRLSPLGLKVQHSYLKLTAEIEDEWEQKFGGEKINGLRSTLQTLSNKKEGEELILASGLIPPEGVARAGATVPALGRRDVGVAARQRIKDLVEQTQRFLKGPKGSLPHYPLWDMNRGFGP